jgi:two-component system, NarL family, nitrate/nitrite response regulator NarL
MRQKAMDSTQDREVRIVLVEDHQLVREGLCMLIDSRGGFRVVGVAGDSAQGLEVVARELPDVVLLDLDLGGADGLELLPKLLDVSGGSNVIILTGTRDPEVHLRAAKLGAKGLVLKDKARGVLLKAIERVCEGEVWFDRMLLGTLFSGLRADEADDADARKIARLTDAERAIIAAFGEGLTTTKEIATRFKIEPSTVEKHLTSIYGKLGVQNRLSLVIFAYNRGLLKPSS